MTSLRLAAVLLLAAAMTTACSSDQTAQPAPVVWTKVDLPAEPVVLAGHGDELVIGMRARGAKVVPRILIQQGDKRREVKVEPKSPYAFVAIWQSIAYDGQRVLALGGAVGGAHSNTRWTVWTGTGSTLTEHPQEFNTFGGQTAGALYSAVITPVGQALLGSWGSPTTGLDAAVWLPQGDKWVRQEPARTALQSTPSLLVGPSFGTTSGDSVVLIGSDVRLAPNVVQQEAAVWRSTKVNQGWTRVVLPEPGNRSQGFTGACTAKLCTVSGNADGKLAIWRLDGAQGRRLPNVPAVPVGDANKLPPPIDDNGRVVQIVANGDKVEVLTSQGDQWTVRQSVGPVGAVTDARLVGRTLYLLARPADGHAALWKTVLS